MPPVQLAFNVIQRDTFLLLTGANANEGKLSKRVQTSDMLEAEIKFVISPPSAKISNLAD